MGIKLTWKYHIYIVDAEYKNKYGLQIMKFMSNYLYNQ